MNEDRIQSYLGYYAGRLELIERMWRDPFVQCYNDQQMPMRNLDLIKIGSIFLAGPTSRKFILEFNWRCFAVKYLRDAGFKGWIYVPEPRGAEEKGDFTERSYIHRWESARLFEAMHKVFWIPREGTELLGLNTNLEFGIIIGRLLAEQKPLSLFAGWPPEAERMGLPNHYFAELARSKVYSSLQEMCEAVAAA